MKVLERVVQIYQILIATALQRQTITYETVAEKVGVRQFGLGYFLDAITKYCAKNTYPLLPVVVVQKRSGKPSAIEKFDRDIDAERERVYGFEWYKLPPVKMGDMK